jgi:hypothetical protein
MTHVNPDDSPQPAPDSRPAVSLLAAPLQMGSGDPAAAALYPAHRKAEHEFNTSMHWPTAF